MAFTKVGDNSPVKVLESDDIKEIDINDFDSKKKLAEAKENMKKDNKDV